MAKAVGWGLGLFVSRAILRSCGGNLKRSCRAQLEHGAARKPLGRQAGRLAGTSCGGPAEDGRLARLAPWLAGARTSN